MEQIEGGYFKESEFFTCPKEWRLTIRIQKEIWKIKFCFAYTRAVNKWHTILKGKNVKSFSGENH